MATSVPFYRVRLNRVNRPSVNRSTRLSEWFYRLSPCGHRRGRHQPKTSGTSRAIHGSEQSKKLAANGTVGLELEIAEIGFELFG